MVSSASVNNNGGIKGLQGGASGQAGALDPSALQGLQQALGTHDSKQLANFLQQHPDLMGFIQSLLQRLGAGGGGPAPAGGGGPAPAQGVGGGGQPPGGTQAAQGAGQPGGASPADGADDGSDASKSGDPTKQLAQLLQRVLGVSPQEAMQDAKDLVAAVKGGAGPSGSSNATQAPSAV